jgi:hypothetical protein
MDPEIEAINKVYSSLKKLDQDSQQRVLDYVAKKLGVRVGIPPQHLSSLGDVRNAEEMVETDSPKREDEKLQDAKEAEEDDTLEGISVVARKWMRRNGLTAEHLSQLFSLGIDDIDLVAKTVPGDSKKERMRSVLLLEGVAAYLGSGVPRFKHDKVKEACLHYDAFDNTNFAKYYRDFNADVSGTKDSDYTLTARGISSATELIKEILLVKK